MPHTRRRTPQGGQGAALSADDSGGVCVVCMLLATYV